MPISLKVFLRFVIVSVIVAVLYGLFLIGTPAQQRQIKFDQQRVSDLQSISSAINAYWNNNNILPSGLGVLLGKQDYFVSSLKDPKTQEMYEYNILGERQYELCANFETESSQNQDFNVTKPASEERWNYNQGRNCFQRETYPNK